MKTLTIDIDSLVKSKLRYEWYVIGQALVEGYLIGGWVDLNAMEREELIKIISKDPLEVEPRDKLLQIFKKSERNSEAVEVLQYFNSKMKEKNSGLKGFSVSSSSNLKFVNGRLSQGYTVSDLKAVIDVMIKEWWGTSMQGYLRPETLFNETKFQSYVNKISNNSSNQYNPIEMC